MKIEILNNNLGSSEKVLKFLKSFIYIYSADFYFNHLWLVLLLEGQTL